MHGFAPFMVLVAAYGGSRLLYGGVYMIGGYGEGVYYLIWVVA
jgi:hypothetical protein